MINFQAEKNIEQEYGFPCKLEVFTKTVHDVDANGVPFSQDTTLVFLVPEDTSKSALFLDNWLPTVEGEKVEVVGIILSPINKPARMILRRPCKECQKPHLLLATVDLKDAVRATMQHHDRITVVIQPASDEENFNV